MKNIGKPCAGEPHARFDEGGQVKACSLLYPVVPEPFGPLLLWPVYGALRLRPYLDQMKLSIDESGISLDFSAMEAVNDFEWRNAA